MAVADFIKAFSLSESCLRSSSSSTTTQVVGLLSVLAISGSVALFTFASSKHRLTAQPDASQPLKTKRTQMNGRYASTPAGEPASEPSKMNGRDGLIGAVELASEPSKMNGGDAVVHDGKACGKRVRFADDVVEPRGNGREYRMRFAQRQLEESVVGSKRQVCSSNSMPPNRVALYKGLRQHRLHHAAAFFS